MTLVESDTSTYREAVAAEVRAMMGRRRITQGAIAQALGLSQAAVSRRLTGDTAFDLDDVFALARYFDVKLSALLPEPAEVAKVNGATGVSLSLDAARERRRNKPSQRIEPDAAAA